MAKFVSAQFRKGARGEGRILSTASLREMHRVRMLESTWTQGQGIGFSVDLLGEVCVSDLEAKTYPRKYLDLIGTLPKTTGAWPGSSRIS